MSRLRIIFHYQHGCTPTFLARKPPAASAQVESWSADEASCGVASESCHVNGYKPGRSEQLKGEGNQAYGRGDFCAAIAMYRCAARGIEGLGAVVPDVVPQSMWH